MSVKEVKDLSTYHEDASEDPQLCCSPSKRTRTTSKLPGSTTTNNTGISNNGGTVQQAFYNSQIIYAAPSQSPIDSSSTGTNFFQQTNQAAAIANSGGQVIQHNYLPKEKKETLIEELLKIINEDAYKNTIAKISDAFRSNYSNLQEPGYEVNPQLVESPDFYKGHGVVSCKEQKQSGSSENVKTAEYRKVDEFAFKNPNNPVQKSLSVESLTNKIHEKEEKPGILGIVGPAGAGKTTINKRLARRTMEMNGLTKKNGFTPSAGSRFRFVHVIRLTSAPDHESTTLAEIIFGGLFPEAGDAKRAFKWLHSHQDKAVIFLDGLDQAKWKITERNVKQMNHYSTASSSTIFFNLFERHLLPGVRIVVSSREHSATSLPDRAWFHHVIVLRGFTEADAKKLFNAITAPNTSEGDFAVHEKNEDVVPDGGSQVDSTNPSNWDLLFRTSSALLPFISIPVFLIFTAIVFITDGTAPSSITDLMAKIIESLEDSSVICERKKIQQIINKLKQFSHAGMVKGCVIFSENDLKPRGLEMEDVRDLILMVRPSRTLRHSLFKGDKAFFFCHQVLQEFLSACFIVEMKVLEFKEFVNTKLYKGHWSVVQRFVCGLLFVDTHSQRGIVDNVHNRDEKKRILRESLISQLKIPWKFQRLQVQAAIYESNDEQLIKSITEIEMESPSDAEVRFISLLLARATTLRSLEAIDITGNMLNVMADSLLTVSAKVQIKKVVIQDSKFSFGIFNKFFRNITSDDISITHCDVGMDSDGLDCNNIRKLAISEKKVDQIILLAKQQNGIVNILCEHLYKSTTPKYHGRFSIKDKRIEIEVASADWSFVIHHADNALHFLRPRSFSFDAKSELSTQYVEASQLDMVLQWETNAKINEMILSYVKLTESEVKAGDIFQEEKILSLVIKFQVTALNNSIATQLDSIGNVPKSLRNRLLHHGCGLRSHTVEKVGSDDDLRQLSCNLHTHQMENLRLVIYYEISSEILGAFIKNVSGVKFMWIYFGMPCGFDEPKLQEAADSSGLRLKIYRYGKEGVPKDDPWIWITWSRT